MIISAELMVLLISCRCHHSVCPSLVHSASVLICKPAFPVILIGSVCVWAFTVEISAQAEKEKIVKEEKRR